MAVSGTAVPYSEAFPQGIRGHLRVKLVAKGDDAWEKAWIESTIYSGQLKGIPGTIDSVAWVEDWDTFMFNRDVVLSTDRREGFSSLTLLYSGKVPSSSSDRCDYTEVLELLIAAGADVRAVGPTGSQTMDDLLRRYGGGPG